MVSDNQLRPQGTNRDRVGREIPAIRPSDVQSRAINSIQAPSLRGLNSSMVALDIRIDGAKAFNQDLQNITNVLLNDERERRKEEEADRNSILEAQAKIQEDFLAAGALAELDLDLTNQVRRSAMKSNGVPEITQSMLDANLEGTLSELPDEDLRLSVSNLANVKAAPVLEAQAEAQNQASIQQAQNNIEMAQNASEEEALRYAAPQTLSQEIAGTTAAMKYDQLIDARTDLRPGEKIMMKMEMRKKVTQAAALQMVTRSEAPAATALNILQGETGIDEIDSLPPEEKFNIFNKSMSIQNYYLALENKAEARAAAERESVRTQNLIDALQNIDNPNSLAIADSLLESAQTPSEAREARKLMEQIEGKIDEPFLESDPRTLAILQQSILSRSLDEKQTAAITRELVGQRISIDDQLRLIEQARKNADLGQFRDAYSIAQDKARAVFPKAFSSKNDPMAALSALMGGETLADATPEEQRQEQLYRDFTVELREKALLGDITTQSEFLNEANNLLERYKAQVNGTQITPNFDRVQDFELDTLNEEERSQWESLSKKEDIVSQVNQRYIKDFGLIDQDFMDGKITAEQAGAYTTLLLPKARAEDLSGR